MGLPSMQVIGSQSMGGSYPNAVIPWTTVVWKDSDFGHSAEIDSGRITLQPGRYQCYAEAVTAIAQSNADMMMVYDYTDPVLGLQRVMIARPRPISVSVDSQYTGEFQLDLPRTTSLGLIGYKNNGTAALWTFRLTIIRLDSPVGRAGYSRAKTMQVSGSLAVPNINYPPAQAHPWTTSNWRDDPYEITPDGLAVRVKTTGRYAFHIDSAFQQGNYSDILLEYNVNDTGWSRYMRRHLFSVASGAPCNFSSTIVRELPAGGTFAIRSYHNGGSTKTITYILTVEEL